MRNLLKTSPAILAIGVFVLLLVAVTFVFTGSGSKTITAEFPRTVSLYEGSAVKILGVQVGKVESVTPAGTKVIATLRYDKKITLPAEVKAAIISPSIVGDRFIQLTPAYTGGPQAEDGVRLGLDRTAVPLELDQIFSSLNDLAVGLGPAGANRPGKGGVGQLSRMLDTTARNFGGQGAQFNQTVSNLAKFTDTLARNKDDIFATIDEVEDFTATLADNDELVRDFIESMAAGAELAAGERDQLEAVLKNLTTALDEVRTFVQTNRKALTKNLEGLTKITKIVVKNRDSLDEALSAGPVALNNLGLTYNETMGTLDTRANLFEVGNQLVAKPSVVLCALVPDVCGLIKPLLPLLGLSRAAVGQEPEADVRIDPSLAGLVEAAR